MDEKTSKRIARLAAKGLRDPEALELEEIRSICASALTQSEYASKTALVKAQRFLRSQSA